MPEAGDARDREVFSARSRPSQWLEAALHLRCLTWNIHRTRGRDGRADAARIHDCLDTLLAAPVDFLALVEADAERAPFARLLDLPRLDRTHAVCHAHPARDLRTGADSDGLQGGVLLAHRRHRPVSAQALDLPGRCPRAAILVEMAGPPRFWVIATHLSLGQPLRIVQMRAIGQALSRRPAAPAILLGDLNEWRPWGGLALSARVVGRALSGPVRATFPARFPLLPLDRVLGLGGAQVLEPRVWDSPAFRAASDHLPFEAQIRL